jgi:hypothetical protein
MGSSGERWPSCAKPYPRWRIGTKTWSIYEDDIDADVVFGALADLVHDVVLGGEGDDALLARCLDLVESLAEEGDPDADEIVAFHFLDVLAPGTLDQVTPSLGEHTRGVLARLEDGELGDPEAG